jgi:hypothetical protein
VKGFPMKIQPDPALHEMLRAIINAPMGLLEYAIDPIVQKRLGRVLARASTLPRNENIKAIA